MGTLQKIIIGVLALLGVLAIISLFLPSGVHVERTRVLKADQTAAFNLVNDLQQWEHWSPWHKLDPNTRWTFTDPAIGTGASYTWNSQKRSVGSGKLTIVESRPDEYIKTEMDFGPRGKASSEFLFEKVPGGTQVKWTMDSEIGWNPVGKYMGLMMKGMVGRSYEDGLHGMEDYLLGAGK